MKPTQTLHDAAEATREYAKGVDRVTAIRRLFAFWMVFTIMFSVGAPVIVGAFTPSEPPSTVDDFEDGDATDTLSPDWGDWTPGGSTADSEWTVSTDNPIEGNYSGLLTGDLQAVRVTRDSPARIENLTFRQRYFVPDEITTDRLEVRISSNSSFVTGLAFQHSTKDIRRWDPGSSSYVDTGEQWNESANMTVTFLLDYQDDTVDFVVNGTVVGTSNLTDDFSAIDRIRWSVDCNACDTNPFELHIDDLQAVETNTVSGTVTYASNGTAVEGASITVNASSASDTTDASGAYLLALDNGTYEITATKGDLTNSITVTVSGSDLTNQNITLTDETLSLDVPTQMFPNETAAYEVTLEGQDVTDQANVTSSDPTNLTVNEATNELEATSDVSFAGEITITAEHDGLTAERNVTVANLSAENVALMQNAADMTAAIWGDVQGPSGERPGGTQLTMRVLFVALLIGAAIATHASGFAGIGGITLIVVMGWFMGWVSDGMALVTVFTGLFIGLNLAANIDYSVRK